MNKKAWIVLTLATLIGLGWFAYRKLGQFPVRSAKEKASPIPIMTNTAMPTSSTVTLAPSAISTNAVTRPPDIPEQVWQNTLFMHKRGLAANEPIEFYGRVVDEHARSVPDARVEFQFGGYAEDFLTKWSNPLTRTNADQVRREDVVMFTDGDGRFAFTGETGMSLRILSISKEGYITAPFEYSSFGYGAQWKNPSIPYTDRDKPVLFYLWEKGQTEPVIVHSYQVWMETENKRRDIFLNLFTGEQRHEKTTGSVDLVFRKLDPTGEQQARKIALVLELEAVNGGILQTKHVLPYRAPENGFVSKLTIEIDDPTIRPYPWKANFYLRLRQGRAYAGVLAELKTLNLVVVTAYVNPHGSRVLEPDEGKIITNAEEIRRLDIETSGRK